MNVPLIQFVKAKRKAERMTQHDLADRAGVGLRFIRDLEQGKASLRLDNAPLPRVSGPGLPFSLRDFLQDRLVERKVGHGTLQARILFFQFPKPLESVLFNTSIETLPSLVGRHADANGSLGNLDSFACRDQPLGVQSLRPTRCQLAFRASLSGNLPLTYDRRS